MTALRPRSKLRAAIVLAAGLWFGLGAGMAVTPAQAEYYSVILPRADLTVSAADPKARSTDQLCITSDDGYGSTAQSLFTFPLSALPPNAQVFGAELRLVADPAKAGNGPQAVQLFSVAAFDPKTVDWTSKPGAEGLALAGSSAPGLFRAPASSGVGNGGLPAAIETAIGRTISFVAKAQGYRTEACFFSTADDGGKLSNRPRLVVSYGLAAPATMSWPQPQFDAQHAGRLPWTVNAVPAGVQGALKTVYPRGALEGVMHESPLIFGAKLYVVAERDDKSNRAFILYGLSPDGAIVAQSPPGALVQPPVTQPVVDPNGVLYYPTANGILLFDLQEGIAPLAATALGSTVVQVPLTIGIDGAVYLASEGQVSARTAYPRHEVIWRHPAGGTEVASVSLSPDQSVAYISALVSAGATQSMVQLTALDNLTGQRLAAYQTPAGDFKTPPTPVAGSDGAYLVVEPCTPSKGANACLLAFNDPPAEGWSPSWSVMSQSIAIGLTADGSKDLVYSASGSSLSLYHGKSGNAGESLPPLKSTSIAPDLVWSKLVLDGGGNVMLLGVDTGSSEQKVYAFDSALTQHYAGKITPNSGFKKDLILAPDGIVYASNGQTLFGILPDLSKLPAKDSNLIVTAAQVAEADAIVYRGGKSITVQGGRLLGLNKMILQSGGTLSLQPGFAVERGAWLILQSGMQP